MYNNKVFKSSQINIGIPVQIKVPINYQNIKRVKEPEIDFDSCVNEKSEILSKKLENEKAMLEKARHEADEIIKEAELEASKILEEAREKGLQLIAEIEEDSRQRGFEKGYEEAKSQYEDLVQEAEFIRENALKEYKEALQSIEKDAMNVILDISRKVIGAEISMNKEKLLDMISQAFERCSNREDITLKVSSADYDFIVENKDRILSMVEGIGQLDIVKDQALKFGALILETPFGSVDAGMDTKLKKIEEAFYKILASRK
ncbi:MAG TPA: flagellar biosynthesis protein [Clostridium sp.]|uniref:Flagellar biosynthesis protein n=1 Tax=Acetivibrio mesophilus TaxID=2487273 RepID=A0A4Q0I8L3_9FIRM|nr:flagellar biosynthesis protein [Clostridium sp. Bc-iso-3]RXE60357.1 flagellar biosynthesis protein [Acetivibrio mesophilus]HHV29866.1 flagellar biosynthesis protein [Clostridium sp.]